ncbi:MAG: hypothetical protein AAF975_01710 [Spirochaetota bacterium]
MIDSKNLRRMLEHLQFRKVKNRYSKTFAGSGEYPQFSLEVDFGKGEMIYPENEGLTVNERQTCNFSAAENAVVLECVHNLLAKGYLPKHIELEPKWKLGHGAGGGRADILVKDQQDKPFLLMECKTYGSEFKRAKTQTETDGGQLFSYAQQIPDTKWLCLYASRFDGKSQDVRREQMIIAHQDNEEWLKENDMLKSFQKAGSTPERYAVWRDTYRSESLSGGIFEKDIQAYTIGRQKYTLENSTQAITEEHTKGKYHEFRTILRKHSIARREQAFEVLVNLFLAKMVDEEKNSNHLQFPWKGITRDNYYDFIDRLQGLYQLGMLEFLHEDVMYISNEKISTAFWAVKKKKILLRKP